MLLHRELRLVQLYSLLLNRLKKPAALLISEGRTATARLLLNLLLLLYRLGLVQQLLLLRLVLLLQLVLMLVI